MDGGPWWAAVHGVATSQTRLSDFTFMHWRRKWHPTPVFLPGESQGRRSLVGCRLWGRTESDLLKRLSSSSSSSRRTRKRIKTLSSESGVLSPSRDILSWGCPRLVLVSVGNSNQTCTQAGEGKEPGFVPPASFWAQRVKNLPAVQENPSSIPGPGRSPGTGNGNPLQYSCLENPMDREAWRAADHGVAKSRTRLRD